MIRLLSPVCLVSVLGACGGSGSSSVAQLDTDLLPEGSVQAGNARVDLPDNQAFLAIDGVGLNISIVEGVGLASLETGQQVSPTLTRVYVYGTRDTATGELVITDTNTILRDPDGAQVAGNDLSYLDPDNMARFNFSEGLYPESAGLEYSRIFRWLVENEASDVVVFGVSAEPDMMPDSGIAIYTGTGRGEGSEPTSSSTFSGSATLAANFTTGLVDVDIQTGRMDFTNVVADQMQISGNSFAGGTVLLLDGANDVTTAQTGGVLGTDAAGLFFGPLETSGASGLDSPGEAGGFIAVGGQTTAVTAFYTVELN